MAHPLDTEDVDYQIVSSFLDDDPAPRVVARHALTGLSAEARGDTTELALAAAQDALLKLLEEAGGG